jgi:ribonuclease G
MHPHVSSQFTGNQARALHALEAETGKRFHFTGSEGLPHDYFDVVLEGTEEEVREKAIPFREGDEVLVTIVEPHMYAVDDAVAKVDGYIISVAGGGSHVGEKRLVRIEEAGRSSATAVLVDDGPGSANGAAAEPKRARGSKPADADAKPARKRSRSGGDAEPGADEADDGAKPRRKRGRSAAKADKAGSDGDAKPGRSPATDEAAPVDDVAAQAEAEESGDDAVESTPRRRGRRGGRRRSAAKAQATSSD